MLRRLFTTTALLLWAIVATGEPVAATYALRASSGSEQRVAEFVLVRTDEVVEVQDKASGIVERWSRDPSGHVFYSRIFLDAGKVIEFQPADFVSAGVNDSWDTIRSVLPIAYPCRSWLPAATGAHWVSAPIFTGGMSKVPGSRSPGCPTSACLLRSSAKTLRPAHACNSPRSSAARRRWHIGYPSPGSIRSSTSTLQTWAIREGDPVIEGLLAQSGLALHAH